MIGIEEKRKIDKFVIMAACSNQKRFTAPFIAKHEKVDVIKVRTRLLQLIDDEQLIPNFEIICPICLDDIQTMHELKDIPMGKAIYCSQCDKDFTVDKENIYVNYSPNKEYFSDDLCNEIRKGKKKF